MDDIRKQYDNFAQDFSVNQEDKNQINRTEMRKMVGADLTDLKVLDLACGDGIDAEYYKSIGAKVVGLDASGILIDIAKVKYPSVEFIQGFAENIPFEENTFDCVFSKYAIMTSFDMQPIFDEIFRVLKPGGLLVYLVTHPLRQFIERKNPGADYFNQATVDCLILEGTVSLKEPTHTMNEYFNLNFFNRFQVLDYKEVWDPAAEQINGGKYPSFFIVKAKKTKNIL